jgi:adenylate cyclase
MDAPLKRHPFLITVFAPVIPHLIGSVFNIWYNMTVIDPLLVAAHLKQRFISSVIIANSVAYPATVAIWLWLVLSLRPAYQRLARGEHVPSETLDPLRRRLVHLPWFSAAISACAWFLGAGFFLISLATAGRPASAQLYWHLPISFGISGFIATTQGFFLVELATQWGLLPIFFRDARPDQLEGVHPISLRTRGFMWAVSASICPIASLLLLLFAPPSPGTNPQLFGVFVAVIGVSFALLSALLIGRSVTKPVNELRAAAHAVTRGQLDVQVPLRRADEFGALIGEFNRMVAELREKERLRQTFGAHVGRRAAEEILARDPGLGGTEQEITVMFVDIRSFTARAAGLSPTATVALLNEFLRVMVQTIEVEHGGMINKFLGDGFMALFGIGDGNRNHADEAFGAARSIQKTLADLNAGRSSRGEDAIQVAISINTGPAIVGSIGSPDRMEFTVIGHVVNVASRLEGLAKMLNLELLLSKSTRDAMQQPIALLELPAQPVKGVDEPVAIYTV